MDNKISVKEEDNKLIGEYKYGFGMYKVYITLNDDNLFCPFQERKCFFYQFILNDGHSLFPTVICLLDDINKWLMDDINKHYLGIYDIISDYYTSLQIKDVPELLN